MTEAQKIQALKDQIQDAKVEKASLERRGRDLRSEIETLEKKAKDDFGIEPENLDAEIEKIRAEIAEEIPAIKKMMAGD
jgi:predicted  nucleic acid-binding Zn-ribbon protein